jgi:CheY-like chemotaxis protein
MAERILVIDDDAHVRLTISCMLQGLGYEIAQAADGNEGVRAFARLRPDVVITDILMPEKEGIETILELRNASKSVRIIAISGGGRIGNMELLDLARKLGADDVLTKPFTAEELRRLVTQRNTTPQPSLRIAEAAPWPAQQRAS